MSEEIQEELVMEEVKVKPKSVKSKPKSDPRIDKLEDDVRQLKEFLHKMKSAIGLPESILPKLDD